MFKGKKSEFMRLHPEWRAIIGDFPTKSSYVEFWQSPGFSLLESVPKLSKSKRFAVVGDVWLSQTDLLLKRLGINTNRWEEDHQTLIAWGWEELGKDCLDYLRGIFSFVVWDTYDKKGWAIRDRVGGRTLYYYQQGSTFYISPRLKNLSLYFKKTLDLIALRDYLCTGFVPGESTLWQGVKELRPGTILSLPQGKIETYWTPQENISQSPLSFDKSSEVLRELLETIIQENLPSQEPVGV